MAIKTQHELALRMSNLYFSYKNLPQKIGSKHWILRDITFDLFKSEVIGIYGSNGAGKTTLLRLIAGIILCDRGEVIRSDDVKFSLLALGLGLNQRLNSYQNIELGLSLRGFTTREIFSLKPEVIRKSGLNSHMASESISALSAGWRSRLAFTLATVNPSNGIIIDDTLSVGDQSFRQFSANTILDICNSNRTVVVASHSRSFIAKNCAKVIILEKGRILFSGDPVDSFRDYDHFIKNSDAVNSR
jgi:lipopolysaccharide transport system ATP-binding protein